MQNMLVVTQNEGWTLLGFYGLGEIRASGWYRVQANVCIGNYLQILDLRQKQEKNMAKNLQPLSSYLLFRILIGSLQQGVTVDKLVSLQQTVEKTLCLASVVEQNL